LNGAPVGAPILVTEVKPNQEITLTVTVTPTTVTIVDDHRNGIGHGDTEIEGNVEAVLALNATGDSRFTINGKTVVARPGVTATREGNKSRTVNDVIVGRHVHVKGTWLPMEGTVQPVLASEIILQDDTNPIEGQPGDKCFAAGQKAEVEGNITTVG